MLLSKSIIIKESSKSLKNIIKILQVTSALDRPKGMTKYSKCLSLGQKIIFVLSSENSLAKLQASLSCSFVKTFSAI